MSDPRAPVEGKVPEIIGVLHEVIFDLTEQCESDTDLDLHHITDLGERVYRAAQHELAPENRRGADDAPVSEPQLPAERDEVEAVARAIIIEEGEKPDKTLSTRDLARAAIAALDAVRGEGGRRFVERSLADDDCEYGCEGRCEDLTHWRWRASWWAGVALEGGRLPDEPSDAAINAALKAADPLGSEIARARARLLPNVKKALRAAYAIDSSPREPDTHREVVEAVRDFNAEGKPGLELSREEAGLLLADRGSLSAGAQRVEAEAERLRGERDEALEALRRVSRIDPDPPMRVPMSRIMLDIVNDALASLDQDTGDDDRG